MRINFRNSALIVSGFPFFHNRFASVVSLSGVVEMWGPSRFVSRTFNFLFVRGFLCLLFFFPLPELRETKSMEKSNWVARGRRKK